MTDDLRAVAAAAARDLADAPAAQVVRWAAERFGDDFVVAASMQDTVLVHLASQAAPGVQVVFLDTGYHFAQTVQTRDRVAAEYDVRVLDVRPRLTVAQQDAEYGPKLHDRDPDLCCAMRKTHPLDEALDGRAVWATGVRRAESASRANTDVVSFDERRDLIKLAPLAAWTDDDVEKYIAEHDVIMNPLLAQGYPSIGCAPCTRKVLAGEDPRAGRWAGTDKSECGIHGGATSLGEIRSA
ncbi:phosphoadenylyl-sulfate reductase [Yimella sp. cx-51]|uniref:phosphoadenylyl-sulfate reductase n=1 Tax=Yimella sp. cx-51 TaxID=2770551 RepID=UPI00165E5994|nr:phosphoadenylyl-sulfate reductase [Yimella sp. cx-51]MBC9956841.1 phosphoadenylyl-sulfate reductase [Yimella sp. cx-51]QTH39067.1 phosphoadenylyl-sulfate reductase [Yimella sp. cx-51]